MQVGLQGHQLPYYVIKLKDTFNFDKPFQSTFQIGAWLNFIGIVVQD